MPSLLSPADIASLDAVYRDGIETVQAFTRPPVLTLRRRVDGGVVDVATLMPISIRLYGRQEQTTGTNAGLQETALGGELKVWSPFPGQVGDTFRWDERPCEVRLIEPERFGIQTVRFELVRAG